MTQDVLNFIEKTLCDSGINYEFGEWCSDIIYPYWVGEYYEYGSENEDGMSEADFTLNGFSRSSWLLLEESKEAIEAAFADCSVVLENGSGVAISFEGAQPIPTGEAELKRMQINLKIKEWKV